MIRLLESPRESGVREPAMAPRYLRSDAVGARRIALLERRTATAVLGMGRVARDRGDGMAGRFRRAALPRALAMCALLAAAPAHAQDSIPPRPPADSAGPVWWDRFPQAEPGGRFDASPLLAEDHWAVRAAARAEALGLAPGYLPAQRNVPRHVVARALESAAQRAEGRGALETLASGWWSRFQAEFPEYARMDGRAIVPLGGRVSAGVEGVEGRLSPRFGVVTSGYPLDPQPLPDRTLAYGELQAGASLGRHLAVMAQPTVTNRMAALPRWEAVAGVGKVALSAGEAPLAYGWGRGGGFIFADTRPLPRVELQTTSPVRLPLRVLGSLSADAFVSRLDEPRHPGDPWMWGMRVALRPQERFTLALTRGAMLGGDVAPVTFSRLAQSFFGGLRQHFDNQILSADVRWRVPSEAWVPLLFYLEWAADDGAGAADEQPAVLAGLSVPAVPGAPALSLGAEYARISECCSHGSWYIHSEFFGEWARHGAPIGHPLGGGGHEARLWADADLVPGDLTLSADAYVRERGTDAPATPGNLFAPARSGASTGGRGALRWRFLPRAELRAQAEREQGSGWHQHSFQANLSYLF